MSEIDTETPRGALSQRSWIMLAFGVSLATFLALLLWGSLSFDGAGGLGVNTDFGEVESNVRIPHSFDFQLVDGEEWRLSDHEGKVVVVDFWASWCGPCRDEAATLTQVYLEYRDRPVEFIGVNIWDQENSALEHLEQYAVPYPNGIDEEGVIAVEYGVRGIPEKFFIAPNGEVRRKYVGPMPPEVLREALDDLLSELP